MGSLNGVIPTENVLPTVSMDLTVCPNHLNLTQIQQKLNASIVATQPAPHR